MSPALRHLQIAFEEGASCGLNYHVLDQAVAARHVGSCECDRALASARTCATLPRLLAQWGKLASADCSPSKCVHTFPVSLCSRKSDLTEPHNPVSAR